MRVTFVLPFASLTGGTRMVFEYARRLRARGHLTTTVVPFVPYWFQGTPAPLAGLRSWLGKLRLNLLYRGCAPGQPVRGDFRMVPWIADAFLPDADVVVATAWPTAYSVARLAPRKGAGCYLVQHREVDSGPVATVDATYRLPLHRIAGSRVTARLLRRELGVDVDDVVEDAIDVAFWSGASAPAGRRSGVLAPFLRGPRKGAADALAALEHVHRARPDEPIRLFGAARASEVPSWVEYAANPGDESLRALYAGSRVFLYPSRYEGFGLPAVEALAAGCALVATRVGAIPDIVEDGASARLVEPGDVEALARGVLELLDDPSLAARMGVAGAAAVRGHDLGDATVALEAALARAARGLPAPGALM